MKVTFVSNFFNHHQKPFSDAMATMCDYSFIATSEMSAERVSLGYRTEWDEPYLIKAQSRNKAQVSNKINSSDVVIIGSAPNSFIADQLHKKKIIFRYSERPLKKGFELWKYPMRYIRWHYINPQGAPIYMLCASAYTAGDYAKFGLFHNRCYKWGYFPETIRYPSIDELIDHKAKATILWCGRFLDWKHPDDALRIAKRLRDENIDFQMELIGTGPLDIKLQQYVAEHGLSKQVKFLGTMPSELVRQHMEHSGIFMFTSDRKEGWGAVLNEAMNSGCAVVASDAAGSTPYLVEDGVNGLVYNSGKINELYEKVAWLLEHPDEQERLGMYAYKTITEMWNAQVAAQRLYEIIRAILSGNTSPDLYTKGPCSRAEVI